MTETIIAPPRAPAPPFLYFSIRSLDQTFFYLDAPLPFSCFSCVLSNSFHGNFPIASSQFCQTPTCMLATNDRTRQMTNDHQTSCRQPMTIKLHAVARTSTSCQRNPKVTQPSKPFLTLFSTRRTQPMNQHPRKTSPCQKALRTHPKKASAMSHPV